MKKGARPDLSLLKQLVLSLDLDSVKAFSKVVTSRLRELELTAKRRHLAKKSRRRKNLSYDACLNELMAEDWGSLFQQYDGTERKYCVYMHGDPSHKHTVKLSAFGNRLFFGKPLYVGMGDSERPFNFVRGRIHTKELSILLAKHYRKEDLVMIVKAELTEKEARQLESKLILFFGIKAAHQVKRSRGGELSGNTPCLLNAQYEPIPEHWTGYAK